MSTKKKEDSKKDSKFLSNIIASDKSLKRTRAENLSKRVENEQTHLVRDLENQVLDLESKIDRHSDLGPKTTTDLSVKNVEAKNWVSDLHKMKLELRNLRIELEIAQETEEEWFK